MWEKRSKENLGKHFLFQVDLSTLAETNKTHNFMSHEKFTELELENQIQEIMKTFNFEKVELHMQDTGHQWYQGSERGMVIPDVEDLRVCARDLLTKAAYHKFPVCNVGTGGFVAYKMPWGMQLTFQLAWS